MNAPDMESAGLVGQPGAEISRPKPQKGPLMATTITQQATPDPQDTFPEALADLAEFFGLAGDMGDEFVTAMQRLDAAMATLNPPAGDYALARRLLSAASREACAAILAAAP